MGAAPDRGLSILSEVEIQALDVSAAVVAAANLAFPRKTVALRILDREGQEVFERHKADLPITERSAFAATDFGLNGFPRSLRKPWTASSSYPASRRRRTGLKVRTRHPLSPYGLSTEYVIMSIK